jgi:hypothetical protein
LELQVEVAYPVLKVIVDFAQLMLMDALVVQQGTHSELMVLVKIVKIAVGLVVH